MADGRATAQLILQDFFIPEDVRDEADTFMDVKAPFSPVGNILAGDNACGFLAAMLERMQAVVRHHRCLGMAVDTENAAMTARFTFDSIEQGHNGKVSKKAG